MQDGIHVGFGDTIYKLQINHELYWIVLQNVSGEDVLIQI